MKYSIKLLFLIAVLSAAACKKREPTDHCVDQKRPSSDAVCPTVYAPVCGCDDKTYGNDCEAKRAGVLKWVEGECSKDRCVDESRIDPDFPCPATHEPVCGCDGITYSNNCDAEKAGVLKWKKGRCMTKTDCFDESKVDPKRACPTVEDPVCGCDGVTYGNACIAEANGILKWDNGWCPKKSSCIDERKKAPGRVCPTEADPVCGCDQTTYKNACEAEKAGVVKWESGICGPCIDESKIDLENPCPTMTQETCGCDGKYYDNPCQAENHGVQRWEHGTCPDRTKCFDLPKRGNFPYGPAKRGDPVCGCDGKTYQNWVFALNAGVVNWEPGACIE